MRSAECGMKEDVVLFTPHSASALRT
jgi:hypothetical protein